MKRTHQEGQKARKKLERIMTKMVQSLVNLSLKLSRSALLR
jgi:hypothetical protein